MSDYDKRDKKTYHLDHIFPTSKGYLYDIPAELIGNIENLEMIKAMDNRNKSNKIKIIPDHILNYMRKIYFENF